MNAVTLISKAKVRSGLYCYTFTVNSDTLTFFVEKRLHPDTGAALGWMFSDNSHEDGGDYSHTKADALYGLCWYLLTRHYVKGLGWCASLDIEETSVYTLYRTVIISAPLGAKD